jgi:salicylate hydroxylase
MGPCRIAIAGCGPAGLTSAVLLARDGHDVTLFDRFTAPQPLGSGLMLQPTGMAVLARLGLAGAVAARGALIERLHGLSSAGRVVLDAPYADLTGPKSFGLGIHRASLFDVLFEAAREAGAAIRSDHAVVSSDCDAGGRWLEFAGHDRAGPFDLVIDALGLHTPLAPPCGKTLQFGALWATLPWPENGPFARNQLEQRYRAAREMVGVLPTGIRPGHGNELALFWSLRADGYARWQDRGLATWRSDVAALWPECAALAEQVTDPGQVTMARYAHRSLPAPAQDRLVHIGDAWHTASPQLGQGANMALLDAMAVAEALRLTGDPRAVPALTVQLRNWHVVLYQWVTAFFTPLYQSDAALPAWVRDWLFAPASRWWPGRQIQAQLMSGLAGRPLPRLGLSRFDYSALSPP